MASDPAPTRPCFICRGTGICGRRDAHWVILNGETIVSHDAYGNSYNNHVCCQCNGVKFYSCDHQQQAGLVTSWDNNANAPISRCTSCGFRWTGIPAETRVHSGMWPILVDAIKEHTLHLDNNDMDAANRWEVKAKAILNQYLDWRPASEKQTIAEKVIIDHPPLMSGSTYQLIGCRCGWRIPSDIIVLGCVEESYSNHLLKTMRTSSEWEQGIDWGGLATKQGKEHSPKIVDKFGHIRIIGCSCGYKCTSTDSDTEFVEHVIYMAGPNPMTISQTKAR